MLASKPQHSHRASRSAEHIGTKLEGGVYVTHPAQWCLDTVCEPKHGKLSVTERPKPDRNGIEFAKLLNDYQ